MDKKAIIKALRDFGQSASNTVADTVAVPVDLIAAGLRSGGLPIPSDPVGGSDWMRQQGLTAAVDPGMAKTAGEAAGMLIPMVGAMKAPQIAAGLNQIGANAGMKSQLSKQKGVFLVTPNATFPKQLGEVKQQMEKLGAPTIRAYWDGEKYIAIEGSHRARAAKELGLTPEIKEVKLKQWVKDHDFQDLKDKVSVARILDYLEYGNHPGAKHIDFEDL
jgi:hypothetical protein